EESVESGEPHHAGRGASTFNVSCTAHARPLPRRADDDGVGDAHASFVGDHSTRAPALRSSVRLGPGGRRRAGYFASLVRPVSKICLILSARMRPPMPRFRAPPNPATWPVKTCAAHTTRVPPWTGRKPATVCCPLYPVLT